MKAFRNLTREKTKTRLLISLDDCRWIQDVGSSAGEGAMLNAEFVNQIIQVWIGIPGLSDAQVHDEMRRGLWRISVDLLISWMGRRAYG